MCETAASVTPHTAQLIRLPANHEEVAGAGVPTRDEAFGVTVAVAQRRQVGAEQSVAMAFEGSWASLGWPDPAAPLSPSQALGGSGGDHERSMMSHSANALPLSSVPTPQKTFPDGD